MKQGEEYIYMYIYNLKEGDNLENIGLGGDNIKTVRKGISCKDADLYKNRWRAFVNTAVSLQIA